MKELEVLKTAILNEVEGYQFYTLAAMKADDPEVKAAFEHLAHEEQQHEAWLRRMAKQLTDQQNPTLEGVDIAQIPSPKIFRHDQVGLESGSLEISVYKIGILMEMASLKFYREAAESVETPALKKLLQHLAEWEDTHLEALQGIYDNLKEEWWDKQGFSPA
ncbi:MAG: ferritin family protein [Bacillota bacterium]|nr:ferritin family protein [Bacillota bacterium]MDW7684254.1 ferritin family protein [Bacillota bacterium]